jgi:hypothetical protein
LRRIRTHDRSVRAGEDVSCRRPLFDCDRPMLISQHRNSIQECFTNVLDISLFFFFFFCLDSCLYELAFLTFHSNLFSRSPPSETPTSIMDVDHYVGPPFFLLFRLAVLFPYLVVTNATHFLLIFRLLFVAYSNATSELYF